MKNEYKSSYINRDEAIEEIITQYENHKSLLRLLLQTFPEMPEAKTYVRLIDIWIRSYSRSIVSGLFGWEFVPEDFEELDRE